MGIPFGLSVLSHSYDAVFFADCIDHKGHGLSSDPIDVCGIGARYERGMCFFTPVSSFAISKRQPGILSAVCRYGVSANRVPALRRSQCIWHTQCMSPLRKCHAADNGAGISELIVQSNSTRHRYKAG